MNQFNRGRGRDDLARLVDRLNKEIAGKESLSGQTAPPLTLPADYSFGDTFFTRDVGLSRTFSFGSERVRRALLGEVFNLFNVARAPHNL